MEQQIRRLLRSKIDQRIFSGASIIYGKPFKKILTVHEGTLRFGMNESVNDTTVFDLQSITKALSTGLIALILEKNGEINLNDPIDRYIPSNAPQNLLNKGITFKHLLSHSSGLSDASLEGNFGSTFEIWRSMFSAPLNFQPGHAIEYSDLGYRIAGKLIEIYKQESLESLFDRFVLKNIQKKDISYSVNNPFNVAGTPDVHGIIDDEQVHTLGGILGCDGLFGSAESMFDILSEVLTEKNKILSNFSDSLLNSLVPSSNEYSSFFDSLACGSKTIGWEVNSQLSSYAGKFHSATCFEKAGGAGTFIWFDSNTKDIFIYLTNYGKPKPFNEASWSTLVNNLEPHKISDIIYENI